MFVGLRERGAILMKRFIVMFVCMVLGASLLLVLSGCESETYVPQDKTPKVSTPVIGKAGVLRVGVDANNSPFAGKPDDKIIGLNVDIAAVLADQLGLKLQVIDVGANPDRALEEGIVDIVIGVDKNDTALTCWRSEAYIQSCVAVFALSPQAAIPTSENSPRIAAQSSSMSAWEVNKQFGQEALESSSDLKSAFGKLADGSVTYVAADAVIGTYAAYSASPRINANIIALMSRPSGYSIAVLDSNSELKQIISDTLVTMTSNGTINLMMTKWLGKPIDLISVPFTEGVPNQPVIEEDDEEDGEGEEGEE